jgi:hypothetical protein
MHQSPQLLLIGKENQFDVSHSDIDADALKGKYSLFSEKNRKFTNYYLLGLRFMLQKLHSEPYH